MNRSFILGFMILVASTISLSQGSLSTKCDPTSIYRINYPLLVEKGYADVPLVENAPIFSSGSDSLQLYFDKNAMLGEDAINHFARVIIKFKVDCNGNVGEFESLGTVVPEIAELLMKAAKDMPRWIPGTISGKPVNTISVITFTISQGKARLSIKK